jgi:Ni/Co efflux regulator RcnB
MNGIRKAFAFSIMASMLSGGVAFAQNDHHDNDHHDNDRRDSEHRDNRDNHHYVRHEEWRKGYHMRHEDWDRGERIDYRHYHLRRPPSGYEWREVDGNYVLAAVATGIVASVIAAAAAH